MEYQLKTQSDPVSSPGSCSESDCCSSPRRRDFIKVAGLGLASLALSQPKTLMAGPFEGNILAQDHFVPLDKKLNPEWVASLYEKGSSRICRGSELSTIGMPVGGIGAGQLYLLGDGTLGCWQIFNEHHFSGYGADNYSDNTHDRPVDQGFAVTVETSSESQTRRLNLADFPDLEFIGEYPIGKVTYKAEGFPVEIVMQAFSPYIPLNVRDSTLPSTLFEFQIKNVSVEDVKVRIDAWLENAVCFHSAAYVEGSRMTEVLEREGATFLKHSVAPPTEKQEEMIRESVVLSDFEGQDYGNWKIEGEAFGAGPMKGTFPGQQTVSGYEGEGLANSFQGNDDLTGRLTSPEFQIDRNFLNFKIGGGGHKGETCLNLLIDGEVIFSDQGKNDEKLEWRSWSLKNHQGKTGRIEIIDRKKGGWGHINVDHIELSDVSKRAYEGPIEKLIDSGTLVLGYRGDSFKEKASNLPPLFLPIGNQEKPAYPIHEKKSYGISSENTSLKPGECVEPLFVLAWHFPNHPHGHEYSNRFSDAVEVAEYVLDNHSRLSGDTHHWYETLYDSTLPHWLIDRLHSTVSTLATGTCQYWENGRFWAWEGVGCCEGTCTHVWNYAHAPARLFPQLERSARTMQDFGAGFHPDTGLVGFRSNDAYAADGQCGTILKAYREHLMSEGPGFLEANWSKIKRALEYSLGQDENDDGLIENSQHNTFDINFVGPNTFVGSLFLAALRAGEEMAREMGDLRFADRCRRVFEKGREGSIARLWNGEYFIQEVDLEKHPQHQYGQGCLSDHLFGQGWARQVGLGDVYPKEKSRSALESIWAYNWAPDVSAHNQAHPPQRWFVSPGEAGLFTCTWPKSKHLAEGVLYRDEVWTGTEYQVAGHMIWEGMVEEALVICRAIHDRYAPGKHNPFNEVECGDHYARGMASWGVYQALLGIHYHGPRGILSFDPKLNPEDFRAAFTTAKGWGTFSQGTKEKKTLSRIDLKWGELELAQLHLPTLGAVPSPANPPSVELNGNEVRARWEIVGDKIEFHFPDHLLMKVADDLEVSV